MSNDSERVRQIVKMAGLMKDVRIAMLTTVAEDGALHSRPMALQEVEFDGDLWFFTERNSRKALQVQQHAYAGVTFSRPDQQTYVSASGHAELVSDEAKIRDLWHPMLKAWFPKGVDDPNLVLIRVAISGAEYWDSPSGVAVQAINMVQSLVTGKRSEIGENEKIDLHR